MEHSPAGHEISVVFGNARGVIERGRQIEDLGAQMVGAAGVLRAIADGGAAQQGLSIAKITEVIGEVDEELRRAGERYAPSGTALVQYGTALDRVQDQMRLIVPRCQTAWDDYVAARGGLDSIDHPLPGAHPGPAPTASAAPGPTPEQVEHEQAIAAARGRMADAYDDFLAEALRFDTQFETWEDAFDAAAEGIREATDGGVQDGFWDDVDGFVAGVLVVLQWAGVVLAVLALVIGGPIIAALGAIVAIAALALTVYQKARGDTGWLELGLAVVGVIPFGKLAAFSGGTRAGLTGVLEGFTGGLGTAAGRATLRTAVTTLPDTLATAWASGARFGAFTQALSGSHGVDDIAARLMGMGDAAEGATASASGAWGAAGLASGHYGWIVNAPFAAGSTVADLISGWGEDATVSDWADQLATS